MNLKVISFNIRCVDDANGHTIKERAQRLAIITQRYDADVMGLQEYTPFWEQDIDKIIGEEYAFFYKYRADNGWVESAPILWKKDKFACIRKGCFWLSDTPEAMSGGWDEEGHNRICLFVILQEKETQKTFALINTHFGFGCENQVKSVRLMHEYMQKLRPYPVIFTGDFNMIPSSMGYAEMIAKMRDVNELTVRDRRSTYHGYAPETDKNAHIDYCFITEDITPISLKIIDERADDKFPSDHYGIFAELEL